MKDINEILNKIYLGDSLELLKEYPENSVDAVLTDPPYFLDKLDSSWNPSKVNDKKNQQVVTSLPAGMRFEKEQSNKIYDWYLRVSKEIFRILKPGGYFFTFSSPRLYHKVACAVDDAGFELRDAFIWMYTRSQPKAMSLDHFIDKRDMPSELKDELKLKMKGLKTPQLKSCYEPIVFGRKPIDRNNLDNSLNYEVESINTNAKSEKNGMLPSNNIYFGPIRDDVDRCFLIEKPSKKEKGEFNTHKTVKPIEICLQLLKLSCINKDAVVLDPFMGSGTTAVSCSILGVNYTGVEINQEYIDIAEKRVRDLNS